MTRAHPDDAMLLDYAAGATDEPIGLLVATHLALCPRCRDRVAEIEAVGGAMLEAIEPATLADDALERSLGVIATSRPIGMPAPSAAAPPREPIAVRVPANDSDPLFPEPLRSYVTKPLATRAWRSVMRGIEAIELPVGRNARRGDSVRLLRIEGGVSIPMHGHRGEEYTLVLAGGFTDASGSYARGDVAINDATITHRPVADVGEACIALAVTTSGLRLPGPLGRLLAPLLRF